jgi:hypothetical protein
MRIALPGLVFFTLSACPGLVYSGADNCTSLGDGDFSNAATWSCGHVPDKDDNVTIAHNINLDISFTAGDAVKGTWTINAGKKLSSGTSNIEFSSSGVLAANGDLDANNITFNNGSVINIASSSAVRVYGNLLNNNNSDEVTVDGNIQVDGNFTNNVNAVISGSGGIHVNGNFTNSASGTVFGCTGTGCNCSNCNLGVFTLPVEFTGFTATLTANRSVKLKWTTATEQNNDYFSVEKSTNGLSFSEIGRRKGAGNSSSEKNYEYTDDAPSGGVTYYRIRQTDFDGKYDYSDVVAVSYEKQSDGSCVLKVFPNPCPGRCSVTLSDCKEGENSAIAVEIVDALGNKIHQHLPYRDTDGGFSFYLDEINALAPGIYVVKAVSEKEKYSKKVMVK